MVENAKDYEDLIHALALIASVAGRMRERDRGKGALLPLAQRLAVAYQGIGRVACEVQPKPGPEPRS